MIQDSRVPLVISGTGAALVGVLVGEAVALAAVPSEGLDALYWVSALTTAPFIAICLAGGYWLPRSEIAPERYRRIARWCLGGLVGFVLLNLVTIPFVSQIDVFVLVGWLRWAGAVGAGGGTVLGIVEARAIQRAVVAERTRVRAAEAESREELVTYLHDLLRHKVRNAVNAIDGHTALLAQKTDADGDHVAAIDRQTDELRTVTREVRTLLQTSGTDVALEPRNVCAVIQDELDEVRSRYDGVEVEFQCQDDPIAVSGRLIDRVFRSVIVNAVVHDPADVSRVRVAVEVAADVVAVRIVDNGPGVPEHKREQLFDLDRGGTPEQGLGLPLVRILVERYGGSIELTESDAGGSVFTIELPRPGNSDLQRGRRQGLVASRP